MKADAWMLRVLDVPRALSARGWPAHLEGELHLEVTDDLVAANRGRWRLRVTGGAATVEPGGRGERRRPVSPPGSCGSTWPRSRRSTPATCGPRGSRLDGRLEGPPAAIELAGRLFAVPWMPDKF